MWLRRHWPKAAAVIKTLRKEIIAKKIYNFEIYLYLRKYSVIFGSESIAN
jgi:hypothetical protein